jgi:hypothetical protein
MSNPKSARPAAGAPGVKLLITAASLVSTIGGWALISNTNITASSAAPAQPSVARSIDFGPLPTLVPPPDPKSLIIKAQPVIIQVNNQPNRPAAAAAPAPQIAGLRVVNAPSGVSGGGGGGSVAGAPPPVTNTGSSKP